VLILLIPVKLSFYKNLLTLNAYLGKLPQAEVVYPDANHSIF
jgi:hypothetical protein